jgi:hypothetical protein
MLSYDQDGDETELFTTKSEGAARGKLHKITGDVVWILQSGDERRATPQSSFIQTLKKELDEAIDRLASARQGIEENPEDLEWPGIEEGIIDQLRSLMRVAKAAGIDVAKYEATISGDAEASAAPIIDNETGLQIGP